MLPLALYIVGIFVFLLLAKATFSFECSREWLEWHFDFVYDDDIRKVVAVLAILWPAALPLVTLWITVTYVTEKILP